MNNHAMKALRCAPRSFSPLRFPHWINLQRERVEVEVPFEISLNELGVNVLDYYMLVFIRSYVFVVHLHILASLGYTIRAHLLQPIDYLQRHINIHAPELHPILSRIPRIPIVQLRRA